MTLKCGGVGVLLLIDFIYFETIQINKSITNQEGILNHFLLYSPTGCSINFILHSYLVVNVKNDDDTIVID